MTSTPATVLVADPPWRFADKLPGPGRGAEKHYQTLTVSEICRFPLPPLAEDAWLFLWRVGAMQHEALSVVTAWGFTVKSELVWRKLSATGRLRIGMGRYVRNAHEIALVCTRGRVQPVDRGVPSVFDAPRGEHSAKPAAFYGLVERLAPGPYVELFARHHRPGWSCYGDEVDVQRDERGRRKP